MAKSSNIVEILIQARDEATREIAKVEDELRDAALRASGRSLQADVEQTNARYTGRVETARKANQRELADRLDMLRKVRIAEVRERHQAAVDGERAARRARIVSLTEQARRMDASEGKGEGFKPSTLRRLALQGIGLTMVARSFQEFTAAAIEARNANMTFSESATLITNKVAQSLPVIRDLFNFGGNLRELVTGELAAAAAATKQREQAFARQNELLERQITLIRQSVDTETASASRERNFRGEFAMLTADEQERGRLGIEQEAGNRRRTLAKEISEEREVMRQLNHTHSDTLIQLQRELGFVEAIRDVKLKQLEQEEARKQRIKELDEQKQATEEKIADLTERAADFRRQTQAAPVGQADQNRFLTGVRQETEREDRAIKAQTDRQIRAIEDMKNTLKDKLESIGEQMRNINIGVGSI